MRASSRKHVSHVSMLTPRKPLHFGRPSRVQRYSSSMHRAMEEDSLMTRYDDDTVNGNGHKILFRLAIEFRTAVFNLGSAEAIYGVRETMPGNKVRASSQKNIFHF